MLSPLFRILGYVIAFIQPKKNFHYIGKSYSCVLDICL